MRIVNVSLWEESMLDPGFIEHLLHEDEGVTLDFKQEQYPFEAVGEEPKSELLKDILAFVNAWRRSTAYILIGVKEIRGDRSNVVGVSNHLDDAQLQQFVNSKTQRPVTFSYQCYSIFGKDIGIIEIPMQDRPVYSSRTYGKVRQDWVYLRRGSSTAVARPDEVAKMGRPRGNGAPTTSPDLTLEWSDVDSRGVLGSSCTLQSLVLDPVLARDFFSQGRSMLSLALSPMMNDPSYIEKVIDYVREHSFFRPVGLRIHNTSEVTARRIRFVGAVGRSYGIEVKEELSEVPKRFSDLSHYIPRNLGSLLSGRVDRSPDVQEGCGTWELNIEFGDIRPGETLWSDGYLFVGSNKSTVATVDGELLGDNIRHPVSCALEIAFEVERRPMVVEDVWPYLTANTE